MLSQMIEFAKKLKKPEVPASKNPDVSVQKACPAILKPFASLMCLLFFGTLFVLFFISVFDTDKTVSETENRNLATMPEITAQTLFDGSFMTDFEAYYTDTFPFRDELMQLHNTMSDFFSGTRTSEDIVLVERGDEEDFAGQDITYDE